MPREADLTRQELEALLAGQVHALLDGRPLQDAFRLDPTEEVCFTLERFLSMRLAQAYSEWRWESLDGLFVRARKTSQSEVQLQGICLLITDQSWTPLRVRLEVSPLGRAIDSFRICLGECGGGPLGVSMARFYCSPEKLLHRVSERLDEIDWVFVAEG